MKYPVKYSTLRHLYVASWSIVIDYEKKNSVVAISLFPSLLMCIKID